MAAIIARKRTNQTSADRMVTRIVPYHLRPAQALRTSAQERERLPLHRFSAAFDTTPGYSRSMRALNKPFGPMVLVEWVSHHLETLRQIPEPWLIAEPLDGSLCVPSVRSSVVIVPTKVITSAQRRSRQQVESANRALPIDESVCEAAGARPAAVATPPPVAYISSRPGTARHCGLSRGPRTDSAPLLSRTNLTSS
jgi:hypothetical protein